MTIAYFLFHLLIDRWFNKERIMAYLVIDGLLIMFMSWVANK